MASFLPSFLDSSVEILYSPFYRQCNLSRLTALCRSSDLVSLPGKGLRPHLLEFWLVSRPQPLGISVYVWVRIFAETPALHYSPGFTVLALISPFMNQRIFFLSFMPEFYKILFLYFHSIQPFYESVVPYCQKQRQLWNTDVQTQHKLEVGFNVALLLPLQSQRENLAHTLRPKCSKSEGPDLDT